MESSVLREHWARTLNQRFSSWYGLVDRAASDPYIKSMVTFHVFTNRVVAAITLGGDQSQTLVQPGKLDAIYNGIPCLKTDSDFEAFRRWVQDGTLKHPQRRTREQHQWHYIVDMQESQCVLDVAFIVDSAIDSVLAWEERTYAIENVLVDWDATGSHYYFRNKHAITDIKAHGADHGESCWICANDFNTDVHRPQQGPCGHYQCRQCFQDALEYATTQYICAFCRSCLVCGADPCKNHVLSRKTVPPTPLDQILRNKHMLCTGDRCRRNELLFGLSPKEFWLLRERTRSSRTRYAVALQHYFSNSDPRLANYLDRAVNEILNSIQAEIARVKRDGRT